MISLRHHIVSVAAIFLALAVGVVLGSSAISERLLSGVRAESRSLDRQIAAFQPERDALRAEIASAQDFIQGVGPMAVRHRLDHRAVTLISTADVPDEERGEVQELVRSAGAFIAGDVRFTEALTDPSRENELRRLAAALMPSGLGVPVDADSGTLVGELVSALTTFDPATGGPRSAPEEREAAFRALSDGGFAHLARKVRPGELIVVLTGGQGEEQSPERAEFLARFAARLGSMSSGAVLAGGAGSADSSGPVGIARADTAIAPFLTTVDNIDQPSGRIAVVMAVREQWAGRSGHYGIAENAQGEIPLRG